MSCRRRRPGVVRSPLQLARGHDPRARRRDSALVVRRRAGSTRALRGLANSGRSASATLFRGHSRCHRHVPAELLRRRSPDRRSHRECRCDRRPSGWGCRGGASSPPPRRSCIHGHSGPGRRGRPEVRRHCRAGSDPAVESAASWLWCATAHPVRPRARRCHQLPRQPASSRSPASRRYPDARPPGPRSRSPRESTALPRRRPRSATQIPSCREAGRAVAASPKVCAGSDRRPPVRPTRSRQRQPSRTEDRTTRVSYRCRTADRTSANSPSHPTSHSSDPGRYATPGSHVRRSVLLVGTQRRGDLRLRQGRHETRDWPGCVGAVT